MAGSISYLPAVPLRRGSGDLPRLPASDLSQPSRLVAGERRLELQTDPHFGPVEVSLHAKKVIGGAL